MYINTLMPLLDVFVQREVIC